MELRDYSKVLQENGIRASVQRIAVYKFLVENPVHPTAEMIYKALEPDYPTLSKTTVYNTLYALEDGGIVKSINIEDGELRYDATLVPHMHFKCLSCGLIFDIRYKNVSLHKICTELLPSNFECMKSETFMWGKCSGCSKSDGCSK